MSSSAQIVTRAMRRLRLLEAFEDPSAADAAQGLAALNAMLAEWSAKGVHVSGDVPLDARFEAGVSALLAVRLADDYGAPVTAKLQESADDGWSLLQATFMMVPRAQIDAAMTNMPSQRRWVTASLTPMWAQKTDYSVDDRVQWRGRRYDCVTAGTSGILGPEGTDAGVTDGTVTWDFVENI